MTQSCSKWPKRCLSQYFTFKRVVPKLGRTLKTEKMLRYLAISGHGQSVQQNVPFKLHALPGHGIMKVLVPMPTNVQS